MANRRLRKEILEAARGLYDVGAIDRKTMREFESLRIGEPKIFSAYEIKCLRLREKVSQAVFAAYLNTSVSTVQKWEIGEKTPSGPALKLLDLVDRKGLKALTSTPGNAGTMKAEYDFSKGKRRAVIPQKGKTRISIFIDNAVLDEFRTRAQKAGTGYQTMMNDALRRYLSERKLVPGKGKRGLTPSSGSHE